MAKKYAHFIPRTDAELARWANNYKEKISVLGLGVGLTPAKITDQQDAAQVIIDAVNRVTLKRQEQEEAIAFKNLVRKREVQLLIDAAVGIKRDPMFTENIGNELGIMGSSVEILRSTLRPALKLAVYPGSIEVSFKKRGQPGVTIYTKLRGEEQWQQLTYATISPYVDNRALAIAGRAETREFMARCGNGHLEVGQESDIVSTLYGG
jgi:hypothetical protein